MKGPNILNGLKNVKSNGTKNNKQENDSMKNGDKRRGITCTKCGKFQSTYSSIRTLCHKCLPKCTEIHKFNGPPRFKEMEDVA